MSSENIPASSNKAGSATLNGVSGWLMFFVIVFFLNALHILSLPFTIQFINWDYLWQQNQAISTYFVISTILEFVSAIVSGITAVLILKRQKVALMLVNIYCLFLAASSILGLVMIDAMTDLFESGVPVLNIANYARWVPEILNLSIDTMLDVSLFMGFTGVLVFAVIIQLYFCLSKRVKTTLSL